MRGLVSADREAVVELGVRGPGGREVQVTAIVDTGFNGWLTLPRQTIEALGLRWRGKGVATLADGANSVFDSYEGFILWERSPRRIQVDSVETCPLLGMALIWDHDLHIEAVTNGRVTIQPR